MSQASFLLFLAAAAALLAARLVARFPEFSPAGLRGALPHFGISLPLLWGAPCVIAPFASVGLLASLTGVFLFVLPALIYSWLAAAWILRFVHEALTL